MIKIVESFVEEGRQEGRKRSILPDSMGKKNKESAESTKGFCTFLLDIRNESVYN